MFDIGFQELIMVFIVSLFAVDPKKLPEFSRKLGKWTNVVRGGIHEMKMHVAGEFRGLMPGQDDVSSLIRKVDEGPDSQRNEPQKDTVTEKEGGA